MEILGGGATPSFCDSHHLVATSDYCASYRTLLWQLLNGLQMLW